MNIIKSKGVRPDGHKKPRHLFAELLGEELKRNGLLPTDILRRIWCNKTRMSIQTAMKKGGAITSDHHQVAKWLNVPTSKIQNIKQAIF